MLHNDQGINPRRYKNYKHIYIPKIGAPQYIRQMLTTIKGETNNNTLIVRDFNTQHTSKPDHPYRKLIRKHRP